MCTSPRTISRCINGKSYEDVIPCGKCAECMELEQSFWFLRFNEESKQWKHVYFVTYHYHNDTIPYTRVGDYMPKDFDQYETELAFACNILRKGLANLPDTKPVRYNRAHPTNYNEYLFYDRIRPETLIPYLRKSDISNHIKRVRSNFFRVKGRQLECKYFFQGEYGPNTLRPHWHGLIFTNEPIHELKELFCSDWQKYYKEDGSILRNNFQEARSRGSVSRYASKYVCKPVEFQNPYVNAGFLPNPPRVLSKGIGKSYRDSTCTDEVRAQIAAVRTMSDYQLIRNLYFLYYLYDSVHGIDRSYQKPRYWLEPLYPMDTSFRTRTVIVNRRTGKLFSKKSFVFMTKYLGYDLFEDYAVREVSVQARRIDRESSFALARQDFILSREQAKYAKLLRDTSGEELEDVICEIQQLADFVTHEMARRDVSSKRRHAQYYQRDYLWTED